MARLPFQKLYADLVVNKPPRKDFQTIKAVILNVNNVVRILENRTIFLYPLKYISCEVNKKSHSRATAGKKLFIP